MESNDFCLFSGYCRDETLPIVVQITAGYVDQEFAGDELNEVTKGGNRLSKGARTCWTQPNTILTLQTALGRKSSYTGRCCMLLYMGVSWCGLMVKMLESMESGVHNSFEHASSNFSLFEDLSRVVILI